MKVYILEDETRILQHLLQVVENIPYVQMIGYSAEVAKAKKEIPELKPEVILADKANERISLALDKLLHDKIDDEDYRNIKTECKEKIGELECQLEMILEEKKTVNIQSRLDKALEAITNISILYHKGDTETKREIIRSIYPEKLEFDGTTYRTTRRNIIAEHILLINNQLKSKKNRSHEENLHNSCQVVSPRVELGSKV